MTFPELAAISGGLQIDLQSVASFFSTMVSVALVVVPLAYRLGVAQTDLKADVKAVNSRVGNVDQKVDEVKQTIVHDHEERLRTLEDIVRGCPECRRHAMPKGLSHDPY